MRLFWSWKSSQFHLYGRYEGYDDEDDDEYEVEEEEEDDDDDDDDDYYIDEGDSDEFEEDDLNDQDVESAESMQFIQRPLPSISRLQTHPIETV